jgi:hypothetical protein
MERRIASIPDIDKHFEVKKELPHEVEMGFFELGKCHT